MSKRGRKPITWTDLMDRTLTEGLAKGKTMAAIAKTLNISSWLVSVRAKALGMSPYRYWSTEDDRFLSAHAIEWSLGRLAKHLNRTERAIRTRLTHLGYRAGEMSETLNAQICADLMGVEVKTVCRWAERGDLKAINYKPGTVLKVRPRDLRKFIINNPGKVKWVKAGDVLETLIGLIADLWG